MVRRTFTALPALLYALTAAATPMRLARRDPVPSFVLQNAPVSHLWSQEQWWPSDVAEHLTHMVPETDFSAVAQEVTLETVGGLGSDVFLTSKDDVTKQPAWITSAVGKPDASAKSAAPATIVLVEKDGGVLDAFFFYFYSFDHGGKVSARCGLREDVVLSAAIYRSLTSSSATTSETGSTAWCAS